MNNRLVKMFLYSLFSLVFLVLNLHAVKEKFGFGPGFGGGPTNIGTQGWQKTTNIPSAKQFGKEFTTPFAPRETSTGPAEDLTMRQVHTEIAHLRKALEKVGFKFRDALPRSFSVSDIKTIHNYLIPTGKISSLTTFLGGLSRETSNITNLEQLSTEENPPAEVFVGSLKEALELTTITDSAPFNFLVALSITQENINSLIKNLALLTPAAQKFARMLNPQVQIKATFYTNFSSFLDIFVKEVFTLIFIEKFETLVDQLNDLTVQNVKQEHCKNLLGIVDTFLGYLGAIKTETQKKFFSVLKERLEEIRRSLAGTLEELTGKIEPAKEPVEVPREQATIEVIEEEKPAVIEILPQAVVEEAKAVTERAEELLQAAHTQEQKEQALQLLAKVKKITQGVEEKATAAFAGALVPVRVAPQYQAPEKTKAEIIQEAIQEAQKEKQPTEETALVISKQKPAPRVELIPGLQEALPTEQPATIPAFLRPSGGKIPLTIPTPEKTPQQAIVPVKKERVAPQPKKTKAEIIKEAIQEAQKEEHPTEETALVISKQKPAPRVGLIPELQKTFPAEQPTTIPAFLRPSGGKIPLPTPTPVAAEKTLQQALVPISKVKKSREQLRREALAEAIAEAQKPAEEEAPAPRKEDLYQEAYTNLITYLKAIGFEIPTEPLDETTIQTFMSNVLENLSQTFDVTTLLDFYHLSNIARGLKPRSLSEVYTMMTQFIATDENHRSGLLKTSSLTAQQKKLLEEAQKAVQLLTQRIGMAPSQFWAELTMAIFKGIINAHALYTEQFYKSKDADLNFKKNVKSDLQNLAKERGSNPTINQIVDAIYTQLDQSLPGNKVYTQQLTRESAAEKKHKEELKEHYIFPPLEAPKKEEPIEEKGLTIYRGPSKEKPEPKIEFAPGFKEKLEEIKKAHEQKPLFPTEVFAPKPAKIPVFEPGEEILEGELAPVRIPRPLQITTEKAAPSSPLIEKLEKAKQFEQQKPISPIAEVLAPKPIEKPQEIPEIEKYAAQPDLGPEEKQTEKQEVTPPTPEVKKEEQPALAPKAPKSPATVSERAQAIADLRFHLSRYGLELTRKITPGLVNNWFWGAVGYDPITLEIEKLFAGKGVDTGMLVQSLVEYKGIQTNALIEQLGLQKKTKAEIASYLNQLIGNDQLFNNLYRWNDVEKDIQAIWDNAHEQTQYSDALKTYIKQALETNYEYTQAPSQKISTSAAGAQKPTLTLKEVAQAPQARVDEFKANILEHITAIANKIKPLLENQKLDFSRELRASTFTTPAEQAAVQKLILQTLALKNPQALTRTEFISTLGLSQEPDLLKNLSVIAKSFSDLVTDVLRDINWLTARSLLPIEYYDVYRKTLQAMYISIMTKDVEERIRPLLASLQKTLSSSGVTLPMQQFNMTELASDLGLGKLPNVSHLFAIQPREGISKCAQYNLSLAGEKLAAATGETFAHFEKQLSAIFAGFPESALKGNAMTTLNADLKKLQEYGMISAPSIEELKKSLARELIKGAVAHALQNQLSSDSVGLEGAIAAFEKNESYKTYAYKSDIENLIDEAKEQASQEKPTEGAAGTTTETLPTGEGVVLTPEEQAAKLEQKSHAPEEKGAATQLTPEAEEKKQLSLTTLKQAREAITSFGFTLIKNNLPADMPADVLSYLEWDHESGSSEKIESILSLPATFSNPYGNLTALLMWNSKIQTQFGTYKLEEALKIKNFTTEGLLNPADRMNAFIACWKDKAGTEFKDTLATLKLTPDQQDQLFNDLMDDCLYALIATYLEKAFKDVTSEQEKRNFLADLRRSSRLISQKLISGILSPTAIKKIGELYSSYDNQLRSMLKEKMVLPAESTPQETVAGAPRATPEAEQAVGAQEIPTQTKPIEPTPSEKQLSLIPEQGGWWNNLKQVVSDWASNFWKNVITPPA